MPALKELVPCFGGSIGPAEKMLAHRRLSKALRSSLNSHVWQAAPSPRRDTEVQAEEPPISLPDLLLESSIQSTEYFHT